MSDFQKMKVWAHSQRQNWVSRVNSTLVSRAWIRCPAH